MKKEQRCYITKNNRFIKFIILLIKQVNYCCINKFSATIGYAIFASIVTFTVKPVFADEEAPPALARKQFNAYQYLELHADLPVDFMFFTYYKTTGLHKDFPCAIHPFFKLLEHEKKDSLLLRQPLRLSEPVGLNCSLSFEQGINYIDKQQMIPIANMPVYRWLLQQYSSYYYQDTLITITVEGMLADLERRKQQGDQRAELVLRFLKRPYEQGLSEELNTTKPLSWTDTLQVMFFGSKKSAESLLSAQLEKQLKSSVEEDESSRFKRVFSLYKMGYSYKKIYTFTSYTTDKKGRLITYSSDDILRNDAEVTKILQQNYPTDKTPSVTSDSYKNVFSKMAKTLIAGLYLYSLIPAGHATPPSRCESEGNCAVPLYASNFIRMLNSDPYGKFVLGENIDLNVLPESTMTCDKPFSGDFDTKNFTVSADGVHPLFKCTNFASIKGNFDLCPFTNVIPTQPVVADKVMEGNFFDIRNVGICDMHRPVTGTVSGGNNQLHFSGKATKSSVVNGTGLLATRVLGDRNTIIAKEAQLFDSPIVYEAGGNYNQYHQHNMTITKTIEGYLPDYKALTATEFTGNYMFIRQHAINSTFVVSGITKSAQDMQQNHNKDITIISSGGTTYLQPAEDSIRITNVSDNATSRATVVNEGRVEIFKQGQWKAVCADTFYQKAAHAACKIKGYKEAKNEGARLSMKNSLLAVNLDSPPVHINRRCSGYENDLKLCEMTATNTSSCPGNEEAFLSCLSEVPAYSLPGIRLTDPNSNNHERFDTTRNGRGRLEYFNQNGELNTICSIGFNRQAVAATCKELGYLTGHVVDTPVTPLPESVSIFAAEWSCSGEEASPFSCPYRSLTDHSCTHSNDVVIECSPMFGLNHTNNCKTTSGSYNAFNFHLTERERADMHRADISCSGLGRIETTYNMSDGFISYCRNNLHSVAPVICRELGFSNGRLLSHLTARPLAYNSDFGRQGGRGGSISCNGTENQLHECNRTISENLDRCNQPYTNAVLFCTDSSAEHRNISVEPYQYCQRATQATGEVIFFSGRFNAVTKNCQLNHCLADLWDADSVEATDSFKQQCNTQTLHTTNQSDWIRFQNKICKYQQETCRNCHLPDDRLLGIVCRYDCSGDALLISQQDYPHNTDVRSRGLIQVRRLLEKDYLKLLKANNEMVMPDDMPVSMVATREQLVSLYSGHDKGASLQVMSAFLSGANSVYHAKTFPIAGQPLLLTEDTVFVKNATSTEIDLYKLRMPVRRDMAPALDSKPYDSISLPEHANNTVTATVKNDWLYVASLNDCSNMSCIDVVRYKLSTKEWDANWNSSTVIHDDQSSNYRIFVHDNEQVALLRPEQIVMGSDLITVSIPAAGGCTSFSTDEIALESGSTDKKTNKGSVLGIAIAGAVIGACVGVAICCGSSRCYSGICEKSREDQRTNDHALRYVTTNPGNVSP